MIIDLIMFLVVISLFSAFLMFLPEIFEIVAYICKYPYFKLKKLKEYLNKMEGAQKDSKKLKDYHYVYNFQRSYLDAEEAYQGSISINTFSSVLTLLRNTNDVIDKYNDNDQVLSLINLIIRDNEGDKLITSLRNILQDDEVKKEVFNENVYKEYDQVVYMYGRKRYISNLVENDSYINKFLIDLRKKARVINKQVSKEVQNYEEMKEKQKDLRVYHILNQNWVYGEDKEEEDKK